MSRIGKRLIIIPKGTELKRDGALITVKGPKGEISRIFRNEVVIKVDGDTITLEPSNNSKFAQSLWGTYGSHLKNMIDGVTTLFEKKLTIEGVGFRVEMAGNKLVFSLGFSHKVEKTIPEGLTVKVEKNSISIEGVDKEKVGQFAAQIRAHKKPEPYKGKGIRYSTEVVRRKEGKKSS